MSVINHLKKLYYARLCGSDLEGGVNHLHVKRIHLVSFVCIVTYDMYDLYVIECNKSICK
jgi:hypothetical protein